MGQNWFELDVLRMMFPLKVAVPVTLLVEKFWDLEIIGAALCKINAGMKISGGLRAKHSQITQR